MFVPAQAIIAMHCGALAMRSAHLSDPLQLILHCSALPSKCRQICRQGAASTSEQAPQLVERVCLTLLQIGEAKLLVNRLLATLAGVLALPSP